MRFDDQWLGSCLTRANSGDEAAYRAFLVAILPGTRAMVARAARRSGLPADEIEDIVQETLIALHLKRHTYEPSLPIGAWLHGIVRHKAIDAFRRRRVAHVDIGELADTLPAPTSDSGSRLAEIARLARLLPDRQRAAVVAVAQGYSGAAAAHVTAMSEGAFRVALHRGIARMARMMEG